MSLFKAYDLRGKVPEDLNEDIAYRIGAAYANIYQPQKVVVGYDIRLESPGLAQALRNGLSDGGVDVLDIGLCGTEEVYFATFHRQLDGGIMVTASHNPKGHNGMKLVGPEARPISIDTGLRDIQQRVESGDIATSNPKGSVTSEHRKEEFIEHLLGYVDRSILRPMKILVNPGNGGAGLIIDELKEFLPFEFVELNMRPDGDFPQGVPNPLLVENQMATSEALRSSGAELGIAWDGDFDRCFFFDSEGRFIDGYYLVGLLAEMMLLKAPKSKIVHDPRLIWNTQEQVDRSGGTALQSRCGHAFIKQIMREEDAIYGGEMSAHHYFRDFSYCDSGMIPWLLIVEMICRSGKSMTELVEERMNAFPCSGEINFRVENASESIEKVLNHYSDLDPDVDRLDGISADFGDWRFNIRASNTEPLLRLNIESRGDTALVENAVAEISKMIGG